VQVLGAAVLQIQSLMGSASSGCSGGPHGGHLNLAGLVCRRTETVL
jgi:hypothetical protein